jgi:serine/threonine-protein kinase RsbW
MNGTGSIQILSRLPEEEFFDRAAELERLRSFAKARSMAFGQPDSVKTRSGSNALLLGSPRAGKTELLRKCFDRLFNESGDTVPLYYSFREPLSDAERFSRDYLTESLAQLIAFRQSDARLIALAQEPLESLARAGAPEDYLRFKGLIDSFNRAVREGDPALMVRSALSLPSIIASRTHLSPFVMFDNFHKLGESGSPSSLAHVIRSEIVRSLTLRNGTGLSDGAVYLLCGLRRPMIELIPPDEELFGSLEIIPVEPMAEEHLVRMIESVSARAGVAMSDSTVELMIQQLGHDLFYIRAIIDAAASRHLSLKTFMEFERLYTEEVLNGRIGHYIGAVLRDVAPSANARRATLEALNFAIEAGSPVATDSVKEIIGEHSADTEPLLGNLHAREMIEIKYGFVNASNDGVLKDYVRAIYRSEISGSRRPVAGEELLAEKLKDSYRLMMSRYNRGVESQLVESLSRFDFQSIPASLFDHSSFDFKYRAMSRMQIRRSLEDERDRVRLPQIVYVNQIGAGDQSGVIWRLFAASGFDGGIYSEASEVQWLIALVNSKEPLDVENVVHIDHRLESNARNTRAQTSGRESMVRWYISKEGFSSAADEWLGRLGAHRSTYAQLDLLTDFLVKLAADEAERRPASEFELVIPIEDEAELIAARTVEQIARAGDFSQEAVNQIKTALIEACINAAEHSDSPDRRIYHRFALAADRLIITVSNKGKTLDWIEGNSGKLASAAVSKGVRGRGLQIIRALMDEVRFDRTDDGAVLVMTKYLKLPQSH